ncbi:MAG TPA: hypothetical protein VIC57_20550 [Candidatus Dormibacteraeota bacterium]
MRPRELLSRLAMLAALVAAAGCMMGQAPHKVSWDLRHGHPKSAVQWASRSDAYQVANVDATILLPGDRTFKGSDVTVRMFGQGDQVQVLGILFPKTTLDDGYRQAKELSREWHLNTSALDSWYQGVQDGRKRGVKDANVRYDAAMSGPALSADGPTPSANVLQSYNDEKPFLLDFELQWVPA